MGLRSWLPTLLAWAILSPSGQSLAEEAAIVETVEGYQIKRSDKPNNLKPCQMVRGYADAAQPKSDKALFFAQLDGRIVVTAAYERWNWPAGKPPEVRFRIDDQNFSPISAWYGAETGLGAQFSDSLVAKLNAGTRIVIGLKEGNVDFDLAGFKPAFEAVLRCNAGTRPAPLPDAGSAIAQAGKTLKAQVAPAPKPAPDPAAAKPPEPSPEPRKPAAPRVPDPSEARAVAYVLARYVEWALQICDLHSTAKQRAAVEAKVSALRPEMLALDPVLAEKLDGLGAANCPPSDVLERHLAILVESSPEEAVARMDEKVRAEMLGIVRPVLSRAGTPSLPSDARIATFLAGLIIESGLERCDIATTGRQRAAVAETMAAFRKDMSEIEPELSESAKQQPCPAEGDPDAEQAITLFIDKTPDAFVEEWDTKRGGVLMKTARELSARLRPPQQPAQPRVATYLYGLVVRDVIKECDIRTTAKQRAGFEERMASLKPEMQAHETALAEQKGAFSTCPPPERIADMEAALAVFIERSPEDFATEMDRRAKARRIEAAPTPAPRAPDAAAKTDCPLLRSPGRLQSFLHSQVPALTAFKVSEIQPASVIGGGNPQRVAFNAPDHAGGVPDITITLPNPAENAATFTIVGVLRSQQIEPATAAVAGAITSLFQTGRTRDVLTREIGDHFNSRSPAGHSWRGQFGGTAVALEMGANATATLTVEGYGSMACGQ